MDQLPIRTNQRLSKKKQYLLCALVMAACFVLIEVGLLINDLRHTSPVLITEATKTVVSVRETVTAVKVTVVETRQTIKELRSYIAEEMKHIQDPRNAKAIDAGIQTAAVYNATGRVINNVTLPKIHKAIDELSALLRDTNTSLNDKEVGLLIELTTMIKQSGVAMTQLQTLLEQVAGDVKLTGDDIHAILADPDIKKTLSAVLSLTQHADASMGHVEKSTSYIEDYLSPKKAKFWVRVIQLFVPKLSFQLN